jgi:hypothetical protein
VWYLIVVFLFDFRQALAVVRISFVSLFPSSFYLHRSCKPPWQSRPLKTRFLFCCFLSISFFVCAEMHLRQKQTREHTCTHSGAGKQKKKRSSRRKRWYVFKAQRPTTMLFAFKWVKHNQSYSSSPLIFPPPHSHTRTHTPPLFTPHCVAVAPSSSSLVRSLCVTAEERWPPHSAH